MTRYAEGTSVDPGRSRAEIESTLTRFGADQFMYATSGERALIEFRAQGRRVRFVMEMPARDERRFTHTEARGYRRAPDAAFSAWEQACKERWRALALVVKAKLAAVNAQIVTFEEEFLAHVVLPSGATVWEEVQQPIAAAYVSGVMPELLPKALGAGR